MNQYFKRLPFAAKLMLIAFIPLVFVIFLTFQFYKEKGQKLRLISAYKNRISLSADLAALIDNLQEERKYSFDYAMTNTPRTSLDLQRPKTDHYVNQLENSHDPNLYQLASYTSLNKLKEIRNRIDTSKISPDQVMHYYSNMIFRLNTLNEVPFLADVYQNELYQDLAAQKILSEMITYLGIIRSNIYNVLYTKKYMVETLIGTVGAHDVYNSYETELLVKSTPAVTSAYRQMKISPDLKATTSYMDSLFQRFKFDSTYTAQQWWQVSDKGVNELRNLQQEIWKSVNLALNKMLRKEQAAQRQTLLFLLLVLLLVVSLVVYTIFVISQTLKELRTAAQKIARGVTGVKIEAPSHDVIGDLAACIEEIDGNNKKLAEAAAAIGLGNFNVDVEPRSPHDILGNALVDMKKELKRYQDKMEQLVQQRTEELNRSNEDLQQFAHVASHDLKEPIRKILTFSSRLYAEQHDVLNEKGRLYLNKIQNTSTRMAAMVEGVLNYSILNATEQSFEPVDLDEIIEGIKNDLEILILQKKAIIIHDRLPVICGIPVLIHQLFYNLLNNALKFSRENIPPHISIVHARPSPPDLETIPPTASLAGFVKIEVSDNGIGFQQPYADQMFHAFTRLNSIDKYEGTGLGLALCKKIVERHHGVISARGIEGQGATFILLLPLSTPAPAPGSLAHPV